MREGVIRIEILFDMQGRVYYDIRAAFWVPQGGSIFEQRTEEGLVKQSQQN